MTLITGRGPLLKKIQRVGDTCSGTSKPTEFIHLNLLDIAHLFVIFLDVLKVVGKKKALNGGLVVIYHGRNRKKSPTKQRKVILPTSLLSDFKANWCTPLSDQGEFVGCFGKKIPAFPEKPIGNRSRERFHLPNVWCIRDFTLWLINQPPLTYPPRNKALLIIIIGFP